MCDARDVAVDMAAHVDLHQISVPDLCCHVSNIGRSTSIAYCHVVRGQGRGLPAHVVEGHAGRMRYPHGAVSLLQGGGFQAQGLAAMGRGRELLKLLRVPLLDEMSLVREFSPEDLPDLLVS
eukprot:235431-Hanusia_phi.AAC.1